MPTIHKNTDGPGTSSGTTPRTYELRAVAIITSSRAGLLSSSSTARARGPGLTWTTYSPRPRRPHDDHKYIHTTNTPASAPSPIQHQT